MNVGGSSEASRRERSEVSGPLEVRVPSPLLSQLYPGKLRNTRRRR